MIREQTDVSSRASLYGVEAGSAVKVFEVVAPYDAMSARKSLFRRTASRSSVPIPTASDLSVAKRWIIT
jgi:hypothetical protein